MKVKSVIVISPEASPQAPGALPALEHIANRPIACHVVDAVARGTAGRVAVVARAEDLVEVRERVEAGRDTHHQVTFLATTTRDDILGGLQAATAFVGKDPAIVHFGDGLLDDALGELAGELAIAPASHLRLLLHRSSAADDALSTRTQKLLGVSELCGSRTHLALTGVFMFGPGALREAVELAAGSRSQLDMIGIAARLRARGGTVDAGIVRAWRRYRGEPPQLLELNRLVLDQQAADHGVHDLEDCRIEGRVIIDPSADVRSSTILGPCIIGAGARITGSYIGPFTSVGAGAEIEGAEVVGSMVAEGVRIMHIQGRIEGSTIGRSARIFRDFRLPRAIRLHVGDGVQLVLN